MCTLCKCLLHVRKRHEQPGASKLGWGEGVDGESAWEKLVGPGELAGLGEGGTGNPKNNPIKARGKKKQKSPGTVEHG